MEKVICLIDGLSSGGAQRQLVGLSILLNQSGRDVKFVWYHSTSFYKEILLNNGVELKQILGKSKIIKLLKVAKDIIQEKPDAVIAYIDGPTMLTCMLRALGFKFRLIVSERNTTQVENRHTRCKFWLYKFSDWIIPNSYSQGAYIQSHYPQYCNKTRVITNFVDTNYFCPICDYVPNALTKIVAVGRVNKQKNLKCFIRALSILKTKQYKFIVNWYGNHEADPILYSECLDLIKKLNIADNFFFHEPTTNILDIYRDSDVLCLPSIYEGFPNVVCEAMSCGLPILCSNVCDNPNIVQHGINGLLFDPNNIEDMSNRISDFLSYSTEKKKEMANESRRIAMNMFSKESFLEKYLELL